MAIGDNTIYGKYKVNLELELEKLTGLGEFKKRLVNEIRGFANKIPDRFKTMELAPELKLDDTSFANVAKQLDKWAKTIQRKLGEVDERGKSVLSDADRGELTSLQKKVTLFERALRLSTIDGGGPRAGLTGKSDKRLRQVLQTVTSGYYDDPVTGERRKITPERAKQLFTGADKITPADKARGAIFNQRDLANLQRYRQELLQLGTAAGTVQRQLGDLGKPGALLSPALGQVREDVKARAETIQKGISGQIAPQIPKDSENLRQQRQIRADYYRSLRRLGTDAAKKELADARAQNEKLNALYRQRVKNVRKARGLDIKEKPPTKSALETVLEREIKSAGDRQRILQDSVQKINSMGEAQAKREIQRLEDKYKKATDLDRKYVKDRARILSELRKEVDVRAQRGKELPVARRISLGRQLIKRAGPDFASLDPRSFKTAQFSLDKTADLIRKKIERLEEQGRRDPTKNTRKSIQKLEKAFEEASAEAEELRRHIKSVEKGASLATKGKVVETTAQERNKLAQSTFQLGRQVYDELGGPGSADRASQGQLPELIDFHKQSIKGLKQAQATLVKGSAGYDKALKQINGSLGVHQRELVRAKERMSGFGSATNQAASLFRQFFRYALGYGALYQALQAVRALTMSLVDLETALKGIQAVTAATASEMRIIEVGIKRVALSTQFNTVEISKAAQVLGQAGVIPKELPSALEATAQFASATGSSIELAADLVTSMRNVFDTVSDNTISNLLTKAINISKLTAEDLKTVVSLSSQISKSYNLTAQQYLSAVTTLRNAGIKPSTVATGLRQGLIELFSPDSKTVKALVKRYQDLGQQLSESEVRDKFFAFSLEDSPLVAVLRELQRLGFRGEGKQTFQRAYDIRAENAINALIDNIGELEASAAELTFGEAAAIAARTQMEALSHSMRNLNAALSVFADSLAGGLLPVIEDWADGLTNVIQNLDEVHNRLKTLGGPGLGASAIGAGVGGLLGGLLNRGRIFSRIAGAGAGAYIGSELGQRVSRDVAQQSGLPLTGEDVSKQDSLAREAVFLGMATLIPAIFKKAKDFVVGGQGFIGLFGRYQNEIGLAYATGFRQTVTSWWKKLRESASVRKGLTKELSKSFGVGVGASFLGTETGAAIKGLYTTVKTFFKNNPMIKLLLILTTATGLVTAYFRRFRPTDVKAQFDAALKEREKAEAEYNKSLESLKEYRFSNAEEGYTAEPGTTAATLEGLVESLEETQAVLGDIFSNFGEADKKLREEYVKQLLEIERIGAEAGTEISNNLLDELADFARDTGARPQLLKGRDLGSVVQKEAASIANFIRTAERIRDNTERLFAQLADAEDRLSDTDAALLQAADEILAANQKYSAILHGLDPTKGSLQYAESVIEFVTLVADRQQEIYRESESFKDAQRRKLEADTNAALAFIESVRGLPETSQTFQNALSDYLGSMTSLDAAGIERLNERTASIQAAIDVLNAQLREPIELPGKISRIDEEIAGKRRELAGLSGSGRGSPDPSDPEVARLLREISDLQDQRDYYEERLRIAGEGSTRGALLDRRETARAVQSEAQEKRDLKLAEALTLADQKRDDFVRQIEALRKDLADRDTFVRFGRRFREDTEQREQFDRLRNAATDPKSFFKVNPETGKLTPKAEVADVEELLEAFRKFKQTLSAEGTGPQLDYATPPKIQLEQIEIERAIDKAEKSKNYEPLLREGPTNLYRRLAEVQYRDLDNRIDEIDRKVDKGGLTTEEEERLLVERRKLEYKQTDAREAAKTSIQNIGIQRDKEYGRAIADIQRKLIRGYNRELVGLRKRLAIALSTGEVEDAQEADRRILETKQKILDAETERLRSLGTKPDDVDEFIKNSKEDMISAFDAPGTLSSLGAGARRQIDILAPAEPALSADPTKDAYLKQIGYTPSADLTGATLADRVSLMERYRDALVGLQQDLSVNPKANAESLNVLNQEVKDLNEEIGRLRAQQGTLDLTPQGFIQQLSLGFNPGQIANGIRALDSHFSNLGKTIQDDIVGGLDQAADSFSNALVRGEDFADGVQQALSDMAYQVAADIVKSGIMSLIGSLIGGAVGGPGGAAAGSQAGAATAGSSQQQGGILSNFFASFGFAKGGVVEKKAKGGQIGVSPAGEVSSSPAGYWTSLLKLFKGGRVEKRAGGGLIKGPGTGTSDSIPGVVVNKQGKAVRGIKVSTGESILTAKTTSGVGKSGIDKLNDLGTRGLARLRAFLGTVPGYKEGGPITNQTFSASEFSRITTAPPLAFASGGTIGDMRGQTTKMRMPERAESGSGHTYRAEVLIGAQEGADVDPNTLRKMDEGITLRVKEFVQEQMRPGGMLQGSRATAGRG